MDVVQTIPLLRIFDVDKARAFYVGFLGFRVDWEHRFEGVAPAYLPLVDPIHDYPRSDGVSITGGYVYRGRLLGDAFAGRYVFGDLGNRLRGDRASTNGLSRGLHVGVCSHVEHGGNRIEDFGFAGVWVDGVAGAYRDGGDTIVGCGWLPGGSPKHVARVAG